MTEGSYSFKVEKGGQTVAEELLVAARDLVEKDHPNLITEGDIRDRPFNLLSELCYLMGGMASESNNPEACMEHNNLFMQMRSRAADIRESPDFLLALAYNQNGVALMLKKDLNSAITFFHKAIDTYRELGVYEGHFANPIANLGFAYTLLGKPADGLEVVEKGLEDRAKVYGPMDSVSFQ